MFVFVAYYLIVISTGVSLFFAIVLYFYQLSARLMSSRGSQCVVKTYASQYAKYIQ